MKGKPNEQSVEQIGLNDRIARYCCYFCILFLASCDNAGDSGDGLGDTTFNFEREEIQITLYTYETQAEVRSVCNELMGSDFVERGCAVARSNKTCDIHTAKIRSVTDNTRINTWGHEYMHCVYGLWHD